MAAGSVGTSAPARCRRGAFWGGLGFRVWGFSGSGVQGFRGSGVKGVGMLGFVRSFGFRLFIGLGVFRVCWAFRLLGLFTV